jgi:hypothetical protein
MNPPAAAINRACMNASSGMHDCTCNIEKGDLGFSTKNDEEEFLTIKTPKAQRAVFFSRGPGEGGQKDTPAMVLPVSI